MTVSIAQSGIQGFVGFALTSPSAHLPSLYKIARYNANLTNTVYVNITS